MGSIPAWAGETAPDILGLPVVEVHPRVGGGNNPNTVAPPEMAGPSPRGRGKHPSPRQQTREGGSIPAWAGETAARTPTPRCAGVHPRVGGGNVTVTDAVTGQEGPSPRGRGKRAGWRTPWSSHGSIPAWAGETPRDCVQLRSAGVHPRVGGGNLDGLNANDPTAGPSPRGRGKL